MQQVATEARRRSGRGILAWTAFLVVAVLAVAAIFAGAIRSRLSPPDEAGGRPTLSGGPAPAPSPLPRPGVTPPGTLIASL